MGLLDRLRRRPAAPPQSYAPGDPTLVVLIEAFEAARADSQVLAEAAGRVDLSQRLLVRHYLHSLECDGAAVADPLGQDGYDVVFGWPTHPQLCVLACRTEVLTALSLSQARSRMAGLAQRLGGDVAGYDVLGPG